MNRDIVEKTISVSYDDTGVVKHFLVKGYNGKLELYSYEKGPHYKFMKFKCGIEEGDLPIIIALLNAPVKSIDKEQLLKL